MMRDEKNEVSEFRFIALEEQFCKNLSAICDILALNGEKPLEDPFNIRQQLETLKIAGWKSTVPFAHFLQPLEDSTNAVRKELLDMRSRGKLRICYIIEQNEKLKGLIDVMLKKDLKAQYLMGNELK